MSVSSFYLVGVPLRDDAALPADAKEIIASSSIVIGESRGLTQRRIRESGGNPAHVFVLDNAKPEEWATLRMRLTEAKNHGTVISLFSDTGLPALFDPGAEVAAVARDLGYRMKTVPGPASWAVACAASLWLPPFYLAGFPPQKTEDRIVFFRRLPKQAHVVLLETPYRYHAIIAQLTEVFGSARRIFLAWELGGDQERLFWGKLSELKSFSEQHHLNKGEFIFILEGS